MDLAEKPQNFAITKGKISRSKRDSERARKSKFCRENLKDFSSCTSLHGIQYLGAKERSPFERAWWLIMILISMGICGYFIKTLWDKWRDTPVIVSFAESSTPIWQKINYLYNWSLFWVYQIPFPAITLCSQSKIMQTKANVTKLGFGFIKGNWTDFTEEEKFVYRALAHICADININMNVKTNYTDKETIDFLKNISYSSHTHIGCVWNREFLLWKQLTNPVTTDAGFCITFNGLDSTEIFREIAVQYDEYDINERTLSKGWTLENGYPKNISSYNTFPRRSSNPDVAAGFLFMVALQNKDLDYMCSGINQGYRVSLHSPSDFPRMSQEYFIASLSQQLIIAIKPNMITTSPGLTNYDPERRKCFLSQERYLKYFKIYTMKNCELECLSNYTYQVCDCVAYWMPREKRTPVCGTLRANCVKFAQYELESMDMKYEHAVYTNDLESIKKYGSIKNQCNCKPSCTHISYDTEISQSDQNIKDFAEANKIPKEKYEDVSHMTLIAYFKESQFIPSKRSELYGISDFLANCGGIMGLFLGFSILSLVEIVYFLTIRPICTMKQNYVLKEIKICTE